MIRMADERGGGAHDIVLVIVKINSKKNPQKQIFIKSKICFTTLVLSKYVGNFNLININHVYTYLRQRKIVNNRAYFVITS